MRHRNTAAGDRTVALREEESSEEEDDEGEEGDKDIKDDEEEWRSLQESMQKHQKKKFDSINTKSHPVHAPYFPDVSFYMLL